MIDGSAGGAIFLSFVLLLEYGLMTDYLGFHGHNCTDETEFHRNSYKSSHSFSQGTHMGVWLPLNSGKKFAHQNLEPF